MFKKLIIVATSISATAQAVVLVEWNAASGNVSSPSFVESTLVTGNSEGFSSSLVSSSVSSDPIVFFYSFVNISTVDSIVVDSVEFDLTTPPDDLLAFGVGVPSRFSELLTSFATTGTNSMVSFSGPTIEANSPNQSVVGPGETFFVTFSGSGGSNPLSTLDVNRLTVSGTPVPEASSSFLILISFAMVIGVKRNRSRTRQRI